jgi:hypothetical protein
MFKFTVEPNEYELFPVEKKTVYAVDFKYNYIPDYECGCGDPNCIGNQKKSVDVWAYITDITDNPKWKPEEDFYICGLSVCYDMNKFDKNKYRKLALADMLEGFTDDRDLREFIWDNYFETRNYKF